MAPQGRGQDRERDSGKGHGGKARKTAENFTLNVAIMQHCCGCGQHTVAWLWLWIWQWERIRDTAHGYEDGNRKRAVHPLVLLAFVLPKKA